jgi:RNA polymerase sigma factor (TIGR02999 family)
LKRGGDAIKISLCDGIDAVNGADLDVVALDHALQRLAKFDQQQERIIELRFFAGLSIEETAAALDISAATVKRDWSMARAWLHREMTSGKESGI